MSRPYNVESTALITLLARAKATKEGNLNFSDPWAVDIVSSMTEAEKAQFSFDRAYYGILTREKWFDQQVAKAKEQYPVGLNVINLGAGLDSRPYRMDDPQIHWYDIDLPEGIESRRHYFKEGPRHQFITGDFTDPALWDGLSISGPVLLISSGVFMYIPAEKLNRMFDHLANKFPDNRIAFDMSNPWFAKNHQKLSSNMPKGIFQDWGLFYNDDPALLTKKFPNLQDVKMVGSFEAAESFPEFPKMPLLFRMIMALGMKKKLASPYVTATLQPK